MLYIRFLNECNICKPSKFNKSHFNQENVIKFLDWLEKERHSSISTRNQRLAAIKSFCNYAIQETPEDFYNYQCILKIRSKKAPQKSVEYLTVEAITLLLKMPDIKTAIGVRDLAMLSLMYESGCRVQELLDLSVGDVNFNTPATVTLTGKGDKSRIIPINKKVLRILEEYINRCSSHNPKAQLFLNRRGYPFTRAGFSYILKKYVYMAKQISPTLFPESVHPHILRHSKAMHLLNNGVNLIYIRDILGHASVTTTEIYARCNPELKRKYLLESSSAIKDVLDLHNKKEKETLLSWLKESI